MLSLNITLMKKFDLNSITAAFSLKQMYIVKLLNLMWPDTKMEGSRIMIFFSEVLHLLVFILLIIFSVKGQSPWLQEGQAVWGWNCQIFA